MTTYIKVMAFEPLPDSDPKKNHSMYTLADGENFRFVEQPLYRNGANSTEIVLQIQRLGEKDFGMTIPFLGNVYVMNAAGKTIATKTTPWIHPDTAACGNGVMTREQILRPIMELNCPNGKLPVCELFRQTGRTETMFKAAIEAAKTSKVVVVVIDVQAINCLVEKFGQPDNITLITYDRRNPDLIDWKQMKVTGKYAAHTPFFDHDVVYYNNKEMFREYEKYNPPIELSGDNIRLLRN